MYFPVSKWDIRPELGDNLKELGKIATAFQELTNDEDIYISSISIDGYASPEGPHDFNILLSQNRAKAIASHIAKTSIIPKARFRAEATPKTGMDLSACYRPGKILKKNVHLPFSGVMRMWRHVKTNLHICQLTEAC